MATYPYKDSQLSIAQRVADLLGRMTLPEKIAQMYSCWLILSADGNHRIRTRCLLSNCDYGRYKSNAQAWTRGDHAPAWKGPTRNSLILSCSIPTRVNTLKAPDFN